jgi:hypothetical protein
MTLERQYNNFLHENPNSKFSFNEWKEWHGNQIKQELANMMKADEELGLYELETFEEKLDRLVSKEPSKFWKESDERFKNK